MTNKELISKIERYEEAIDKLTDILIEATETESSVCYVTDCDAEPLRMAIEALEKQIPKKPSQDSVGLFYFPTCPNCHKELEEYDHHCECGQALDWSGVNE